MVRRVEFPEFGKGGANGQKLGYCKSIAWTILREMFIINRDWLVAIPLD